MSQFGDIDVTVLLDMSLPLTGLETVTAAGIQRLIDLPGSGTCTVRLQRLGVDDKPQRVHRVRAGDLLRLAGPMRWPNWWQRLEHGPRKIVLLVVHEINDAGYVKRPAGVRLMPLALAVGILPDVLSQMSFIPMSHILHTPVDQLDAGWKAVARCVERVRCIPDDKDPRLLSKLAFTSEDQVEMNPTQPDMAYARKAGYVGEFLKTRQRQSSLVHAR